MKNDLTSIDPNLLEQVTGGAISQDQLSQAVQGIATSLAQLVQARNHPQNQLMQILPFMMIMKIMRQRNSFPPW